MSLTDTTSIQEMTPEALAQARGVTASASWLPKAVSADHLEEPATAYEDAPLQPGRVALRLVSQQQLVEVPLEAVIDKLPALADGQGAVAAALEQPQDIGDSADMAHILDYARGALAKLREMKAMTGDSELDELISRLAADLEQGNLAGLREMLDDIQKAIGDAAAKGRESDAPETPEQKAERLWQQVKEDIKEAKDDIHAVGQAGVVGFEKEEEEKWKKRLQAIEDMPEETDAQKAAKLKALEQYYHDWGKQLETLRNDPANSPEQNPNAAAVLDDKTRTNDRRIERAQQAAVAQRDLELANTQHQMTAQEVATAPESAPKSMEQLNTQSADTGLGAISLAAAPTAVSTTPVPASALPAVQLSTPIQLTEADPASTGQLPAPTAPVQLAKAEVGGPSTSF
jgi:hypothetical protein